MNLRKALERAKKEREMNGDAAGISTAKSVPTTGAGWQPPRYSESRNVAIDISTAVRNHCVAFSTEFAEVNYYKVLRTQLRQISQNKNWNTVMVTSASPNEGKTVTIHQPGSHLCQGIQPHGAPCGCRPENADGSPLSGLQQPVGPAGLP